MCFAVTRGEVSERTDVNHALGAHLVATLYQKPLYPLAPLGDLVERVQYGCSSLATSDIGGLPMLRMNNLQNDGWDLASLKYIELPPKEAETYRLSPGDLLFNRTNSKELVGKCEVFREMEHWVFASYLIRVTLDKTKALPDFVSTFLATAAGRAQIDRVSRQIVGMSNVNAEELKALLLPLPPLDVQQAFVADMDAAREARRDTRARADELLSGLDGYLLEQLGLVAATEDGRQTFAVRLKEMNGKRIDAPAYRPFFAKGNPPATPTKLLREIAAIDANKNAPPLDEADLVPYVGLPECTLTEVREVAQRPYSEVKGRSVLRPGDILFARIEPSVFNKKYVLVDDLKGYDYAYTSTEFYTVRAKPSETIQGYLYAMFFCSFVFAQVKGKTTGSSGRRRIDPELFANLQIPVPDKAVQQAIADEVSRRRAEARRLRQQAEQDWAAAKARFERRLLGGDKAMRVIARAGSHRYLLSLEDDLEKVNADVRVSD